MHKLTTTAHSLQITLTKLRYNSNEQKTCFVSKKSSGAAVKYNWLQKENNTLRIKRPVNL